MVHRNNLGLFVAAVIMVVLVVYYAPKSRTKQLHQNEYVSFDKSMNMHEYPAVLARSDFQYVYDVFKKVYEKNSFEIRNPQETVRIPKILHLMWLGGKLSDEFQVYVESWKRYHPQWTVLFWTDNPLNYDQGTEVLYSFDDLTIRLKQCRGGERLVVDVCKLQFNNRIYYDGAHNYGERSDILKWEIVYRFGGTYVDTDFECFRPLDIFHHTYDFYTGIQPLDTNIVQLGAALYGAIPGHPILKACVEGIKDNQHIAQIVTKTGPIYFTKIFLGLVGKTGLCDIAFPTSYFYPCGYEQRGTDKNKWCKPESYAVHHWAGSWLKPEAFVRC